MRFAELRKRIFRKLFYDFETVLIRPEYIREQGATICVICIIVPESGTSAAYTISKSRLPIFDFLSLVGIYFFKATAFRVEGAFFIHRNSPELRANIRKSHYFSGLDRSR